MTNITNNVNNKYKKYYSSHVENDTYFGLGIENECYFVFDEFAIVTGKELKNNTKPDRYCVNYYNNFKKDNLKKFYDKINNNDLFKIPIIMNSHYITKYDKFGECNTIKYKVDNPKFNGTTLFQLLMNKGKNFREMYDKYFSFDGDTFEFTTQHFYKTTVEDCVNELFTIKQIIINEIQSIVNSEKISISKFGNFSFQKYNFGFAKILTNYNNIALCNNATYHINITLPIKLNSKKEIEDFGHFRYIHKKAIKIIQWIEPLIIACYGSPDIFSIYNPEFSSGSQRIALSRYISIGTYDTKKMITGKLLNSYHYSKVSNKNKIWYNKYHQNSGYNPPKSIGYDFNFNKFKNHGIEIRFLDYFPEFYLQDFINILLLLCQFSLSNPELKSDLNPIDNDVWNDFTVNCIKYGSKVTISQKYYEIIKTIFVISDIDSVNPINMLTEIVKTLYLKYKDEDFIRNISPNMKLPKIYNFNEIMYNIHVNTLFPLKREN